MEITIARFPSSIGMIEVSATERGIRSIGMSNADKDIQADDLAHLRQCIVQLQEYFAGDRHTFDSLPLAIEGTQFSNRVWDEASQIPYGETRTYGELASSLGDTGAARAVGTALGRNPIAIIVPCHRIVAAGGNLGGFAWGIERKKWLLDHEKSMVT